MARKPFRNNARLVALATLGALLVFLTFELLLRKSRDFSPDFLASVLLYGLTVVNLTLLLVLLFVLGRNVVRVVLERRRGVLGARFRMRLVLVFLLLAIAPAVLLVLVGSDLLQQAIDRWFSVDVDRVLSASQALGTAYRRSLADGARVHALAVAREIEVRGVLGDGRETALRRAVAARARELRLDMVGVYTRAGEQAAVMDPRLPGSGDPGGSEGLIEAVFAGREAEATVAFGSGELIRVAAPIRDPSGSVAGAAIVSAFVPGELAAEAREVQERYTKFKRTEADKEPIKLVYLSLYLLPALFIAFGAVWFSLYLARRITTPLRLVADGAERIARGERGVRVDFPSGDDELQALVASFNRMSERLARSEEEVEHTRAGLVQKNQELEERRRLMETVLETVGTGVVVVDAEGAIAGLNAAATRLLGLDTSHVGRATADLLKGPGLAEVQTLLDRLLDGRATREEREVRVPSGSLVRHLAVTVVPLRGVAGSPPGAVVVVDDLTSLIRAQRVAAWGEVARKLAHEIKNPLTPIQLSAQRVRKAYVKSAPDFEKILNEGTSSIVHEVDALKNLVDEFAQFARLPAVRPTQASLHAVIEQALSLYDGLFAGVKLERQLAADVPLVRLDVDQIKRVLINLVDNAIEATDKKGTVVVSTEYDVGLGRVRFGVADDGPGVAPENREKLFVPSFSTKKRGSGLGLAIVSRIVQEHHGSIRVEANQPRGARFVVEIPL